MKGCLFFAFLSFFFFSFFLLLFAINNTRTYYCSALEDCVCLLQLKYESILTGLVNRIYNEILKNKN